MRFCLLFILSILFTYDAYAQNKGIEKLSMHKIDSLKHVHVDTIIWYHSYCGECFFRKTDAPIKYYNCQIQSGYDLSYNAIIYQQKGKYFIINFDCSNLIIKRQLDSCNSITYFISIIPMLNFRDKTIEAMRKKGEFLGPFQIDGFFEDADIYLNNEVHRIHSEDNAVDSNSNLYKEYKQHFDIDKEVVLLKFVAADVAVKKQ